MHFAFPVLNPSKYLQNFEQGTLNALCIAPFIDLKDYSSHNGRDIAMPGALPVGKAWDGPWVGQALFLTH